MQMANMGSTNGEESTAVAEIHEGKKQGNAADSFLDRVITRYAKFLVKYPYVNIIVILLLFIWAGVTSFVPQLGSQSLPNFSQPTKGFEPRGTVLSNNKNAYDNLQKAFSAETLINRPKIASASTTTKRRTRSVSLQALEISCHYLTNITYDVEGNKIIYEDVSMNGNILDANKLKKICQLQDEIMRTNAFFQSNVALGVNNLPCPSHSIANAAAVLANRTSCMHLTNDDVKQFRSQLVQCARSYRDGSLKSCVTDSARCTNVPRNCSQNARIFYNSFHFLTDSSFAKDPSKLKLTLVSERLRSPYQNTLYKPVYEAKLKDLSERAQGHVRVAAFEFYNLKFEIFEEKLFVEGSLLSCAILIVFFLIMLYSSSVFIGLMTFLCILIAAVLAYFFYGIVFRLSFFPFLNILTLVFLVGIGADDAFVYIDAWNEAKIALPFRGDEKFEDALVRWTAYSVKHAVVAMFVTSFTTAAAFFASASSSIIAIRCFGIYAGTSILMNYMMMVAWFPVAVVISEKSLSRCMNRIAPKWFSYPSGSSASSLPTGGPCSKIHSFAARVSRRIFSESLPAVVLRFRYIFVCVFALLGTGGLIALFVSPKLQLPITKDFQMFSDSSSIEQFPLHYKSKFNSISFRMPIIFVFGVKNDNTASTTNPDGQGYLNLQQKFTATLPAEQSWLMNFCGSLQNSSFVLGEVAACTDILTQLNALTIPCNASVAADAVCCGHTLPVPQKTAELCIHAHFNTSRKTSRGLDGILFNKDGRIAVIVVTAMSHYQFTEAYDAANVFYTKINSWFDSIKATAPESFRAGFWHSYLDFFDLQKSLADGTPVSLGISVVIAFSVVLLTTCNFLLSVYTVVSILFVISVTMGSLVLAGWRLNIMESIIFSVAAGLAVDFTLHYGVAYRTAVDKACRKIRVRYSFTHIGSAVTMGAITTFISGLVMAPASVLVYIQLSHFLMAIMTFSWIYATFFFMPLCSIVGPVKDFCQLNLCSLLARKSPKTVKNMSRESVADQHEVENIAETVT